MSCFHMHTSSFLAYCFILYDSNWGSLPLAPKVSVPQTYMWHHYYYYCNYFKGPPFLFCPGHLTTAVNRHTWFYVRYIQHVFSVCWAWDTKQFKVHMVRAPHLWLSCQHPVLAYTTIGVIALQWSPTVVGATLAHLYECEQPISVGVQ